MSWMIQGKDQNGNSAFNGVHEGELEEAISVALAQGKQYDCESITIKSSEDNTVWYYEYLLVEANINANYDSR